MVKNLKLLREDFSISQETLGKAVGLSGRQIYTYEKRDAQPDIATLSAIADYFGVSIDYLVGRETEEVCGNPKNTPLGLSKFGERITNMRNRKGLTSKFVASSAGITNTYYALIEKGMKIPKFETAIKILNVLEVSADEVLMDSLVGASLVKATYLQQKLASLSPKKRTFALHMLESILSAVEEPTYPQNEKDENPT